MQFLEFMPHLVPLPYSLVTLKKIFREAVVVHAANIRNKLQCVYSMNKRRLAITVFLVLTGLVVSMRFLDEKIGCIRYVGGVVGIVNNCESLKRCDFYKLTLRKNELESCYFGVATHNKNVNQCKLLQNDWSQEGCIKNISRQLNDKTLCQEIKNENNRNDCLKQVID
jgi:hypothetical protein